MRILLLSLLLFADGFESGTTSAWAVPLRNSWHLGGQVLGGGGCATETHSESGWVVESRICELMLHHPEPPAASPSIVRCRADRCAQGSCPAPAMPHSGEQRGPVEACEVAATEGGAISVSGWIARGEIYVLKLEPR